MSSEQLPGEACAPHPGLSLRHTPTPPCLVRLLATSGGQQPGRASPTQGHALLCGPLSSLPSVWPRASRRVLDGGSSWTSSATDQVRRGCGPHIRAGGTCLWVVTDGRWTASWDTFHQPSGEACAGQDGSQGHGDSGVRSPVLAGVDPKTRERELPPQACGATEGRRHFPVP